MFQAISPRLGACCGLLAAAGLTMASCDRQPAPRPPAPAVAPPPAAAPPLASSTLGRAELLQAIAAARAAYSAGQSNPIEALTGRRFAVRQAFGCVGPRSTTPEGQARWAWTASNTDIEIALTPADWTTAPVTAQGGGAPWESVEGFWLTRPWLMADGCPAVSIAPPAAVGPPSKNGEIPPPTFPSATPPTAGLAAVFKEGGSRVGRRDGRAFAFTLHGDPAPEPPVGGYRLLIEGRFAAFPDGRAIRCHTPSADAEPVCVAAAQVDRVAFEDASGKLLRDWRLG